MARMGGASTGVRILCLAVFLTPLIVLHAGAQSFPSQSPNQVSPRERNPFGPTISSDPLYEEKRVNALNADRYRSMVSDTEKLVRLATQLEAEIAANTEDGLTPKELKEAAEIEKLARNVREKMARSFGNGPIRLDPGFPAGP